MLQILQKGNVQTSSKERKQQAENKFKVNRVGYRITVFVLGGGLGCGFDISVSRLLGLQGYHCNDACVPSPPLVR